MGQFIIADDHEGPRQVGFGLSFFHNETRTPVSIVFARFAVLALIAALVGKLGFALAGSAF
jgi:hypothetical protein